MVEEKTKRTRDLGALRVVWVAPAGSILLVPDGVPEGVDPGRTIGSTEAMTVIRGRKITVAVDSPEFAKAAEAAKWVRENLNLPDGIYNVIRDVDDVPVETVRVRRLV